MRIKIFSLIFTTFLLAQTKSEECTSFGRIYDIDIMPKFVGTIESYPIENAVSVSLNGVFTSYFTAELDTVNSVLNIIAKEAFTDYELNNTATRVSLPISIQCASGSVGPTVRLTISAVNNYAPEFSATNIEIKIPTPLYENFELTSLLENAITAIDYDLYYNVIQFSISGSDLFTVGTQDITESTGKSTYQANIFAKTQITRIENDEIEFTLIATDIVDNAHIPKSSSITIRVYTNPNIIFIDSPRFEKPLYNGKIHANGTIEIEEISLDSNTYDDKVDFDSQSDIDGLIILSHDGPKISILIDETKLTAEVLAQRALNVIIEASRVGDLSGFAVVILEIVKTESQFSFSKSLYEGEYYEKNNSLILGDIAIVREDSLDGVTFNYSQDANYFNFIENSNTITIRLKEDISLESILSKNILLVTIDAHKNEVHLASTVVMIRVNSALIPQFDKSFYIGNLKNGILDYEAIMITQETFSDDIEVTLSETNLFNVALINDREVKLNLNDGVAIPTDETLFSFEIEVKERNAVRSSKAFVVIENFINESGEDNLAFNAQIYEGTISKELDLGLPPINLNNYEGVDLVLSGTHKNLFNAYINEDQVTISLKSGVTYEQISSELYLHFMITANHLTLNSAFASFFIGIERSNEPIDVGSLAFDLPLYEGKISPELVLNLPSIALNTYEGVTVSLSGTHAEFFNASLTDEEIKIEIKDTTTYEQIESMLYLNLIINASHPTLKSTSANIIIGIERTENINPDESILFNSKLYEGKIMSNLTLLLPSLELNHYEDVNLVFSGTNAESFAYERIDNEVTISLKSGVTYEQISSELYLHFMITAFHPTFSSGSANVVIGIVKDNEPINEESLSFDSSLYEGKISPELVLNLPSIALNTYEGVTVSLSGTHAEFFNASLTDEEIKIEIKDTTTYEQIESMLYLNLIINASHPTLKSTSANIIIGIERTENINPDESILFNSKLYEGKIMSNLTLLLPSLELNHYEDVNLVFSGTNAESFAYERIDNEVTISLKSGVTYEQISSELYLHFMITAFHPTFSSGSANVVIGIVKDNEPINEESLSFDSSLYEGKLSPELVLNLPSIALNTYEGVTVSLSGTHAEFFNASLTDEEIKIEIKDTTTYEQIESMLYLNLIINASHPTLKSASANIIIGIERTENINPDESILFNSKLYEGKIMSNLTLLLPSLELNHYEDVNFVLSGTHAEFFANERIDNEVTISLESGVTYEQISSELYLHFMITAFHPSFSSSSANVVIGIVKDDDESNPDGSLEFNSALYEGKIKSDLNFTLSPITLNTYVDVNVIISGIHAELFSSTINDDEVKITLNNDITFDEFLNDSYIRLIINAIDTQGNLRNATANIIIGIERDENDHTSQFEKSLYIGSINNQKILALDSIFIKSTHDFNTINIIGDDSEYFNASANENFITISLAKEISEDLIFDRRILNAIITAEYEQTSISTNLVVTLPRVTEDQILRFEKSYYVGTLSGIILDIEDIILEIAHYDDSVDFSLTGTDESLFDFDHDNNAITLKMNNDITEESFENKVFLSVKVIARKNGFVTAESLIFVHLNVQVNGISPIEFESPVYRGKLTYDRVLIIDKVILTSNEDDLSILHKGDFSDKFQINPNKLESSTEIEINFIQQPIDVSEKFYYFYIEAYKIGAPKIYATIIIEIVDKVQLHFDEIKYFGRLDVNQNLILDSIELNSVLNNAAVEFRILEGQSEYFTVNPNNALLTITKSSTIPDLYINNYKFIWFYLEAFGSSFYAAKTMVVIEISSSIDIPIEPCYDTLDPTQPFFETGSYSFTIMNDESGFIGKIHAIINNEDITLSYGLQFENSFLFDKMYIEGGDIILRETIPTGMYKITGISSNYVDGKNAYTSITLRVLEAKICDDGKVITTVTKALAIEKIEENTISNQIMYAKIGDCEYEIVQVYPNVLRGYIEIDQTTHYLKNIDAFDRESYIFKDYLVAQVLITLQLICDPSEKSASSTNSSIKSLSNNVFTDEILYSRTITQLNLQILDQNDNAPIFTNPPNVNYNIGLPDSNLIELTMPKYLLKAEAYDIDEGVNAEIQFSTSMPSTFDINSVTGEIYPIRTMSDESFGFMIYAIDRNGAGLRTSTSIVVSKLTNNTIIEMIVDASNDLTQLFNQLSNDANLDMRILSSTQIPFSSNMKRAIDEPKIKIYAYAFQPSSANLINAEDLIDKLISLNLDFTINYSTVEGCKASDSGDGDDDDDDSCSLKGWIFAVSFLGTFVLLIIVAIPIIWFFWLKKLLANKNDNSADSLKEELGEDFHGTAGTSSPIVSTSNENVQGARSRDADVFGIEIEEEVPQDPIVTDAEKLNNKLLLLLDDNDSTSSEKKYVSFNELVERIEVLEDQDEAKARNITEL